MNQTSKTIEEIKVDDLIPYATNSRTHSPEQVAQIAASIQEFGFTNPVLIDANGTIIAGHGRVLAARKLALKEVPCIRLGHLTPAQVRAYVIADNKLALNAGWNEELLASELKALREDGFNIELTGFVADELADIFGGDDGEGSEYTKKIEAPIYTPKGERPAVAELTDSSRASELIRRIEGAKLPEDVSGFLRAAASRHIVFNYERIAEFYCHADKSTQELMEDSALVIIDYGKAMQLGYARLKEDLLEIMEAEEEGKNVQ
jgi:hypothetical protein